MAYDTGGLMSFVERTQSLILAGGMGTGKSHIAMAMLLLGCQRRYLCRYTTASAAHRPYGLTRR